MDESRDDDLRRLLREFRASVSEEFAATHARIDGLQGQMTELSDEVRARVTTAETAVLHAIRDLGRELDRRLGRVEGWMAETDGRLRRIEDAQSG